MIKIVKNDMQEVVMLPVVDNKTGKYRLVNIAIRSILTREFKNLDEIKAYLTGLLDDKKIKSLWFSN